MTKSQYSPRTLADLDEAISAEENRIKRDALAMLADGTLTPELALVKWAEMAAFNQVRKRLDRGTPKPRS